MKKIKEYAKLPSYYDYWYVLLSLFQASGAYIDGWAHIHINQIDTFFTPWHAVFYSGSLGLMLMLGIPYLENLKKGYHWKYALPREYMFALYGVVLFGIAGFGDLLWHTAFGIEKGLDLLFSPTHMLLAVAGAMILSGPLHAIWYRDIKKQKIHQLPVAMSFALTFMILNFMTQALNPISVTWLGAANRTLADLHGKGLGFADIIIYTVIFMGLLLTTVRHWRFSFGSMTLVLFLSTVGMTLMHGKNYELVFTFLVAGFLVDILYAKLVHNIKKPLQLRIFGAAAPLLIFALYVPTVILFQGTWWSPHMLFAAPVTAAIVGYLMTYVLIPPGDVNQRI